MKEFYTLLKKELREERGWIIGAGIFLLGLEGYIFFKSPSWERGAGAILSILPLVSVPLVSVIWGYSRLFARERNTQFFIFSLPVRKELIILSKAVVLLFEILIFTGIILFSVFLILPRATKELVKPDFISFLKVWLSYGFGGAGFGFLSMGAYLVSRCIRRVRGVVGFIFFILSLLIYLNFFKSLGKFFAQRIFYMVGDKIKEIYIGGSFGGGFFIFSIIILSLAILIFKRRMEV